MSNASPFWASRLQDLSIDIKSATSHGVLTPQNALWSFGSPFGTPTFTNSQHGSSLGSVRVHSLTLFAFPGACDMTPGSTYRPATLQPPCLGREPRLGLRHNSFFNYKLLHMIVISHVYINCDKLLGETTCLPILPHKSIMHINFVQYWGYSIMYICCI
jgi:hypothetical protein